MKKVAQVFLLVVIPMISFGQSIHILHNNEDLTNKSITVPVYKDTDFTTEFSLQNTATDNGVYQVNRTILDPSIDDCSLLMFCTGTQCYPPSDKITWTPSDKGFTIYANTTLPDYLLAHYTICETACKDLNVLYRVYRTASGTKDTAYLTIKYSCIVGIEEERELVKLSDAYPNPATSDFSVNYFFNTPAQAYIELTDALCRKIIEKPLIKNETLININTSQLSPGVYFYTLIIDNKRIKTKRLIINE
ncbi:MAG TPA: T9SS type A sorting domain-containing protein [Bacteroidia bacterium]|jgi:hypothetical protein|nr:T9SS type A sorting domain-containing protein [Bacteroidia bacterium]